MTNELFYDKLLQEWLKGELRVLNVHLPRRQKGLSELLIEKYPHVVCSDGNAYMFKRGELEYLASILDKEEWEQLFLPMLIEVGSGQGEAEMICREKQRIKSFQKFLTCLSLVSKIESHYINHN